MKPTISKKLSPLSLSSLDGDVDTITDASIENETISASLINFSIIKSRIAKSDFAHSNFERLNLDNVIIENCIMLAGAFSESSWHTTAITGSLCSGIQLDKSILKNVRFTGCKLDVANFRYAKMTNIIFDSCVIDSMDFYNAELKNVQFIDCEINDLELQSSKLRNVDFRESKFIQVKRVADLKGAKITTEQVIFLSSQLANQAGIIVDDE